MARPPDTRPPASERALDPEVAEIRDEMERQQRTQAELARLLGLESAQVSRVFSGKRRLNLHEARQVWAWLGAEPKTKAQDNVIAGPGMVPLYGWTGASSVDGSQVLAEQILLGHVPRHPNQANFRDSFALKVADVSMSPRYEPGEVIYLVANQWPARGQDCVVVTTDGFGLLKRFTGADAATVRLEQLNPERALAFERIRLQAIHAVVGRG